MKVFTSFGLAKRLYLLAAMLSIALIGTFAYAWFNLHNIAALTLRAESQRVPQLTRMAALELNVTRVSLQLRHAMLARNAEEKATALADVATKRKLIEKNLADYEASLFTPVGRERFKALPPLVARFWELGATNIQLIQSGTQAEAFGFLVDKTIPARNDLLNVLGETVEFQSSSLARELEEIRTQTDTLLKSLAALVLFNVVGLVGLSWYLARVLKRRVSASQAVAERVRDGNLSTPVVDNGHDEFSPLLSALADMQNSLIQVVTDVRSNAESVATASAQIAQGNQDLSIRTEQQASALQETAATMEELGTTVRNNADNAKQANQLAQGASAVAAQGGDVVGQVVTTMQGINDSSRRIGDIISVIDGIAFQTNILALNAAVEAARAGEQGRGFAVVASEVRSLAQRSAEAAKEIKTLILRSVEQVEQGTTLVDQAGKTMGEIVGSIRRVSDIVAEITSASVEQSSGVQQVGDAVSQMDQVTQQNAALVEESAAAAESLKVQAQQLVSAVATFKLTPAEAMERAVPVAPAQIAMVERRGPNRAQNVTRPAFGAKRKPASSTAETAPSAAAPAKTGTDDWTSF